MIDYGIVRSGIKPDEVEMDEYSVYVNTDINEIEVEMEEETHTEYEYHMIRYNKNEYIRMIAEKNSELEETLTDTQLTLCDVYELIGE